jgi:hypothetical protein
VAAASRRRVHPALAQPRPWIKAIGRCIYHSFLPPFLERQLDGRCHYQDQPDGDRRDQPVTYLEHMRINLVQAAKLVLNTLSDEERAFHRLE